MSKTADDLFEALDEAVDILAELEEDGADQQELEMAARQADALALELRRLKPLAPRGRQSVSGLKPLAPRGRQSVSGTLVDGKVKWALVDIEEPYIGSLKGSTPK